jgi:hypothetical protein
LEQTSVASKDVITLTPYRLAMAFGKEGGVVPVWALLVEVGQHVFQTIG